MTRTPTLRLVALIVAAALLPLSARAQQASADAMTALRDQWKGVSANVTAAAKNAVSRLMNSH